MLTNEQYQAIEQEIVELQRRIEALELQLDEVDSQYRWMLIKGIVNEDIPSHLMLWHTDYFALSNLIELAKACGDSVGGQVRMYKDMANKGWIEVVFLVDRAKSEGDVSEQQLAFEEKAFKVHSLISHSEETLTLSEIIAMSPVSEKDTRDVMNYLLSEGFLGKEQ